MSVRPVTEEPEMDLERWSICLDGVGEIRLLGSPQGTTRARISSPIVSFDVERKAARTMSGRQYRLHGDADPAFAAMCAMIWFQRFPLTPEDVTWLMPGDVPEHLTPPSPSPMRH
jgi:hypothetical protein